MISFLFLFCSIRASEKEVEDFSPLPSLDKPLLFKASIKLRDSNYSGLILIKEMPDDSSVHVVFLSELGLNLLDMAYRNQEFEVISVQEFLNRSLIIKTLQNDFRCLLLDLSLIEGSRVKTKKDGVSQDLKFRHKSQRYIYSIQEDGAPVHIRRKYGLCGRMDLQMGKEQEALTVEISHRGIRLNIDLKELERL